MSEAEVSSKVGAALALAHAALDDAFAADLGLDARDAMLAAYRELERLRNRLAGLEHGFVAEVGRRGVAFEVGAACTAALLRDMLRITRADAFARVRAADAAGPHASLAGEPLAAPFPHVAAAQVTGAVSPAQARIVVGTVDRLPDAVQAEHGDRIEADLVGYAQHFDPTGLGKLAERIAVLHDPDGVLADHDYRQRHRDFAMTVRPDGSSRVSGEWPAELTERARTFFDAMAGPRPEADGVRDSRSPGQRRADALLGGFELLQRAGQLPAVNGVSATIVVHLSDEAWRTGHGTAVTSHGAVVPAGEAMRWAGGDARVMVVAMNSVRAITATSGLHRIFTEGQRLALAARDVGCTFPGCDAPAALCQIHHLVDWADGGPTTLANGALVCSHDHRERIAQGWTARLIDERIAWMPPAWLDPDRTPRYNHAHHPARL